MWKYMGRRLRDTFEKSANYFDKRSTTGLTNAPNNINENSEYKKSSTPCRWFVGGKCWDSTFKNRNDTNSKRWNFEHLNSSWLGAITWSSALVLGWYTSQFIHLKHKYHCRGERKPQICNATQKFNAENLLETLSPYFYSVSKNANILECVPKFEEVVGSLTPTVHLVSNDQTGDSKERTANGSSTTPDISEDDLGNVLNSIENKLGLAAIENGQHQEGLNLLRSAANRNHAPALYNLGLCYELGLGVTADEKVAMDLYRSAAALEHPGAMYNLGIYYGQGRGGLARDTETATRLLRLAAVKGQEDAVKALKSLEIDMTEPLRKNEILSSPSHNNDIHTFTHPYAQNDNMLPVHASLFVESLDYVFQPHNREATAY